MVISNEVASQQKINGKMAALVFQESTYIPFNIILWTIRHTEFNKIIK